MFFGDRYLIKQRWGLRITLDEDEIEVTELTKTVNDMKENV